MKDRNKFLFGAITGAAIGSLVTLLTAPESGEEMRQDIKRSPGKAKDAFYEKLDDLKDAYTDAKNDIKDKLPG